MPALPGRTRLVVYPDDRDLRLDQFLARVTSLSRRAARRLIEEGSVAKEGQVVRVMSRPVAVGEVVDVSRPPEELGVVERPAVPEVSIVYRDRWLVAVNKPAGILSQPKDDPLPLGEGGELAMNHRLLLALAREEGKKPYLRLFHRLDRVTSGLLLFAADRRAPRRLAQAWRHGEVERRYLAVVEGEPAFERRRVDEPIRRQPDGAWRFEVAADGRPATTEVEVLGAGDGLALVGCRLVTGRTHQVRVHLAWLGLPVLGDRLYGSAGEAPRPLLHAAEVSLPHPEDGRLLTLTAAPPADLVPHLERLASAG